MQDLTNPVSVPSFYSMQDVRLLPDSILHFFQLTFSTVLLHSNSSFQGTSHLLPDVPRI